MIRTDKQFSMSDEIVARCREVFEKEPAVRRMEFRAHAMEHQGNFAGALALRKQIEELFARVLENYQEQVDEQVERIEIHRTNLPHDDLERIDLITMTLFIAIDIMDFCLMDINDVIKKTDASMSFEEFKDLEEMAHVAREQLSRVAAANDFINRPFWCDAVDGMYEQMQNKAKAIKKKVMAMRKKQKSKS